MFLNSNNNSQQQVKSKIRAVIIDDEPGNIITLTEMLKEYCPEIVLEGSALNPILGCDLILGVQPQLVFLDIEMPYGNAFDMLDKLSPVNFEVVFITAFNDYAIKAFKYAALDYILKPVNIEELKTAVRKVKERLQEKSVDERISYLLSNMKQENAGIQKIALPAPDGIYFEAIENVIHLEAEGSYSRVFLKGKKSILVSRNLKEYEDILPPAIFCRVHHSHIINVNFVKKYFKGRGGYVEMEDGASIEISVRKKNDFFDKFKI
jgi:two-component system LytT family response regulator